MSIRQLRRSFQRRFQLDRFILEEDHHVASSATQASFYPQPAVQVVRSPLLTNNYSISNKPPVFVSCLSPLSLPLDLLIYFLKFLTPGDLWKLCQVSRQMHYAVMTCMSRSQRFGFEAIRILRQEHPYTQAQLRRVNHEKVHEELRDRFWITHQQSLRMVLPPLPPLDELEEANAVMEETVIDDAVIEDIINGEPTALPPPPPPAAPSRGVMRSQYWVSQANFLFAAILESSESFRTFSSGIDAQGDLEMEDVVDAFAAAAAAAAQQDQQQDPAMGAFWTNQYETTKNISSQFAKMAMVDKNGRLESLTKERFWSIVQVLFDSNLVELNHRRAIINCARYMTAKIDSCFAFGSRTKGKVTLDTDYYEYPPDEYSVHLGPHLALYLDAKEPRDASSAKPYNVDELFIIPPPQRLQSTFQAMLWSRCLTDLVGIYNRIQELHDRPTVVGTNNIAVPDHDPMGRQFHMQGRPHPRQHLSEFVEPFRPIGRRFNGLIHRIWSVAKKRPQPCSGNNGRGMKTLSKLYGGSPSCSPSSSSTSLPISPTPATVGESSHPENQFVFHSGRQSPYYHRRQSEQQQKQHQFDEFFRVKKSDSHLIQQHAANQERSLMQRRVIMEERKRRDTLLKEELLGLCHMACGLFMIKGGRTPEQGGPRSIMTLLRQGSPWKKGVWREGEWRHAPIDLDHDVDETIMAYHYHLEWDYKYLKGIILQQ
ncbi:hypothetical protein BGX33_000489, partial [Mortierella sp. NVP41]